MVWLDCAVSVIRLKHMLLAEFFQQQLSFKIFGNNKRLFTSAKLIFFQYFP